MAGKLNDEGMRLGMKRIFGYGIADFGLNLYYTGLNLFLYYYYTDVLEIRPVVAGLIFALPLVWDAITDPIMGAIANRTRSRLGSYRPYIAFGAIPLALSFVAMFAAPLMFPATMATAAAISHVVFRTCYTVVSIPYSALSAKLTRDSGERGALAGMRMFFAPLGGMFTAFTTLQLAASLGAGDMKAGFLQVAMLYAVIASCLLLFTFAMTRERLAIAGETAPGLAKAWVQLRSNRALMVLIAAILAGSVGSAIFGKALIYYLQYMPGIDIDISLALTALIAMTTFSVPGWTWLSRYLSKRTVWLTGSAITASLQLFLLFFQPTSTFPLMVALMGLGIAGGAYYLSFWSMLPDTVEYGEFRSGVRDEGMIFGINQLALKAASGIGIGLLGLLLDVSGYAPNVAQSEQALSGIRIITLVIPLCFTVISASLIFFYPIDRKLHARLLRAIAHRKDGLMSNTVA